MAQTFYKAQNLCRLRLQIHGGLYNHLFKKHQLSPGSGDTMPGWMRPSCPLAPAWLMFQRANDICRQLQPRLSEGGGHSIQWSLGRRQQWRLTGQVASSQQKRGNSTPGEKYTQKATYGHMGPTRASLPTNYN